MANKVKCTCGHSWNKSDSSKKDVNVCHVCGKDNTMKNGGWLDNYGKVDNANDSDVSLPEGFVGMGNDTTARNYSPAWGGQFQTGGSIPGSVGFTYARTADSAPSEGKYAKKTLPSAQDGVKFPYINFDYKKQFQNYNSPKITSKKVNQTVDETTKNWKELYESKDPDKNLFDFVHDRLMPLQKKLEPNLGHSSWSNFPASKIISNAYINYMEPEYLDFEKRKIPPLTSTIKEIRDKALNLSDGELEKLLKSKTLPQAILAKPKSVSLSDLNRYKNHIDSLINVGYTFQNGGNIPSSQNGDVVNNEDIELPEFVVEAPRYTKPKRFNISNQNFSEADETLINQSSDKIDGLELKMTPEYQYRKYLESLPQLRQGLSREEELRRDMLRYADVTTDLMQLGNFIPHPYARLIGQVGNVAGGTIDAWQSVQDVYEGDYLSAGINAASAFIPNYLSSKGKGYLRSIDNIKPNSVSDKVASLTKKGDFYRPLVYAKPSHVNNPAIKRGLNFNRSTLGTNLTETVYDATDPKFQNGGEMKFYQEGLDWKPRSMQNGGEVDRVSTSDPRYAELYKNRQVGSFYDDAYTLPDLDEVTVTAPRSYTMDSLRDFTSAALYGAPANVMKMESIPQAAMTEGIEMLRGRPYDFGNVNPNFGGFTSNQRDLSQTMGYDNPEGFLQNAANIGLSTIDPLVFSGLAGSSIGKRATVDITKDVVNPNKIVFDLMDESIDPLAEVLKKIKTYEGPTPFAKDVRREAYNYVDLTSDPRYLERVKRIDKDFDAGLEPLLKEFNDDEVKEIGRYFPFNISTADKIPYRLDDGYEIDVLGRSGINNQGSLKKLIENHKINPSTDRYIEINESRHLNENIPARGTVHHELKHHWTNALLDSPKYKEALEKLTIPKSSNEFLKRPGYDYYSKGTEIDAHVMTNMRDEMVQRGYLKDHFDELTKDKLNDFILKEKDYPGVQEYFSPGKEMIFDRSNFVNFFNKYGLPSTVIGGVAGSQAIEQKRDGGIIKDNRGQWDYPGEVTEIDSNEITMQGVPYNVLGVSDTGDTKLMQPGNDYKFKGSKVTEFPVAKNGGWLDSYQYGGSVGINQLDEQPKKKLNQLTNFTNNPDKTNWLDNLL